MKVWALLEYLYIQFQLIWQTSSPTPPANLVDMESSQPVQAEKVGLTVMVSCDCMKASMAAL